MRMCGLLNCFWIVALLAGCYGSGSGIATPAVTTVPTQRIEPTFSVTAVPTQPLESTPSLSLQKESQVPTYPPETRTKSQCLDVGSTPIHDMSSNGVLILQNRAVQSDGSLELGTIHLDVQSGQINKITMEGEVQIGQIVSPNRKLVAYERVTYNTTGKIAKTELVVADAKDQPLHVMPWEDGWILIPAWLDNQRLVINFSDPKSEESASKKPATLLVLDPFRGERQILIPDFPRILNTHPTVLDILPFWEGWQGAIYDPTLTRAVYPRFVDDNDEMYTYAIWDPSKRQLIATLDEVFSSPSAFGGNFPMPKWFPDGSRFVFQGQALKANELEVELYEVGRDGQVKQLTHLSSVAYIWESSYSWSPDGRHIAMFLGPPLGAAFEKARVAVLDTATLNVTDYCVNITFSGEGYGGGGPLWAPIWSPDGRQFVITDWYEKNHRRVILVDIEKNIATQIVEDMEPVGWMVSEP